MPYRIGKGRSKYPPHDRRNRSRPHTLIFRVTPKQQQELKCREFLCGRTIQDYMLQSAMTQQVIVAGDRELLERIESKLDELEPLLKKLDKGEIVDQPVLEELRTVYEMTMEWK